MMNKTKTVLFGAILATALILAGTAMAVGPDYNPNSNWGDLNPSGGTTGHANPALSWQGWVYPGTDDCGFKNGASIIGSPATLPDAVPFPQAPW